MTSKEHEIFILATDCDRLFHKAISALPRGTGSKGADSKETSSAYRPLVEYHQRFQLWSGYLGVFAEPETSLDRRLQFDDGVRQTILQLLELVRVNLSRGNIDVQIQEL